MIPPSFLLRWIPTHGPPRRDFIQCFRRKSAPLGQTTVPASLSNLIFAKKPGDNSGRKIGPTRRGCTLTRFAPSLNVRSSRCGPHTFARIMRRFMKSSQSSGSICCNDSPAWARSQFSCNSFRWSFVHALTSLTARLGNALRALSTRNSNHRLMFAVNRVEMRRGMSW